MGADGGGGGVTAHEVEAERCEVHRLVLAQQTEARVRVVAKLGCERDAQEVECLLGRLCHQSPPWAGAVCVTVCPGSRRVYVTSGTRLVLTAGCHAPSDRRRARARRGWRTRRPTAARRAGRRC